MTTIHEMDEFFNFDDATNHVSPPGRAVNHLSPGPYDANLVFAEEGWDEDSFTALQHFSVSDGQMPLNTPMENSNIDTSMMGPDDFLDFPRWIEGMDIPSKPCGNCRNTGIHCKIMKEGQRKGSCTSCVALGRTCSLTDSSKHSEKKVYDFRCSGKVNIPHSASTGVGQAEDPLEAPSQSQTRFDSCPNCGAVMGFGEGDLTECCNNCSTAGCASQDALGNWTMNDNFHFTDSWNPPNAMNEELSQSSGGNSTLDLTLKTSIENSDVGESGPKSSTRFSRESVRILRTWLGTHHRHPYPTDVEKDSLMLQTGLNKTQITNWLANARRRGKVRPPRSTSPGVQNYANGMDIPRRATPALEQMNPMERWQHSPPEHEPASVTAIAKAVTSSTLSSGQNSSYSYGHTDDGSNRSLYNVSSASSFGTSHSSGGSFASAYSHRSRGSFGSFGSFGNGGRRRRRRQAAKPVKVMTAAPIRTFQCTFCTETFKTKHDWQRHEKSLHLSLERWVCSPNGATINSPETGLPACVYCDLQCPPLDHAEVHNHFSCAERSLEERTFYRKDHLRQHLHLVHDVKFQAWSMDAWKVVTPEIRSRCGFCGLVMDSWTIRIDHLADHFKGGKSMADWKGDWGFEPQVLSLIENGMPPYLIHDERNTMKPYTASTTNRHWNCDDHIKHVLSGYIRDRVAHGETPTDDELLARAREILNSLTVQSLHMEVGVSWFRDLIMYSGEPQEHENIIRRGQKPGATAMEFLDFPNSKDLTVDECAKERSLRSYVRSRQALGLTPTESELQAEACKILDETEAMAAIKCTSAVKWFKYLINASTSWLSEFRRRAGLPRIDEMANEHVRSTDDKTIDYSIHNQPRLERELKEYVQQQMSLGIAPSDEDLRRQARMIVYGNDDEWNQTWVDEIAPREYFKRQNGLAPALDTDNSINGSPQASSPPRPLHWDIEEAGLGSRSPIDGIFCSDHDSLQMIGVAGQPSAKTQPKQPLRNFLNDANCYGRLYRELASFVARCMSINNPNQHIPTDPEIQNQARWIIYDDDDPWNQTAADNIEWLVRFKRDVGISLSSEGPGLPIDNLSWLVSSGGSGFSPPLVNPQDDYLKFNEDVSVKLGGGAGVHMVKIRKETISEYVKSLKERFQPPPKVFCSRALENGLREFVKAEVAQGRIPSDESLQSKAKEILGVEITAADDPEILTRFKELVEMPTFISPQPQASNPIPLLNPALEHGHHDIAAPIASISSEFFNSQDFLATWDRELMDMDLSPLSQPLNFPSADSNSPFAPDLSLSNLNFGLNINTSTEGQNSFAAALPGLKQQCQEEKERRKNEWTNDELMNEEDENVSEEVETREVGYADLHRVYSATASPLRRRASSALKARGGGGVGL